MVNNRALSEEERLLTLLGRYKFVLAVENAECPDYVTEKLWRALRVGSVPVYHGAPNAAADFLPRGTASAVLASDWSSAEGLAGELRRLDDDNVAYKRMLAHKRKYAGADQRQISNK